MSAGALPGQASSPHATPSQATEWQFLQCFGERSPGEDIQEGRGGIRGLERRPARCRGLPGGSRSRPSRPPIQPIGARLAARRAASALPAGARCAR
jgi:hypothetical protein